MGAAFIPSQLANAMEISYFFTRGIVLDETAYGFTIYGLDRAGQVL